MFTITSWVSFILPPTSYPARTSLLVTVLLCQTGIFNAVIRDTPKQDGGMTALESWCLAMIGLVFEALLAYVLVLLELFKRKTYQVCHKHFNVKFPLVLPYSM